LVVRAGLFAVLIPILILALILVLRLRLGWILRRLRGLLIAQFALHELGPAALLLGRHVVGELLGELAQPIGFLLLILGISCALGHPPQHLAEHAILLGILAGRGKLRWIGNLIRQLTGQLIGHRRGRLAGLLLLLLLRLRLLVW